MENIKSFDSFNEKEKWIHDAIKNPGSLRRSLKKKKGEKITQTEISSEISKLRKKDRDKDKPGLQLGDKDRSKYKKLTLARTLRGMHENIHIPSTASDAEKAKCYDEIVAKMVEFYDEGSDADLCTIGEWLATYLGYL